MSASNENESSEQTTQVKSSLSRRAMLKSAAAAMPAVLTLQSGAAYARSSNLIGAASTPHTDGYGRTLCLDVQSVYQADGSGQVYDLGDPPRARVIALVDRDLRTQPQIDAPVISEGRACLEGRTVYYVDETSSSSSQWTSYNNDDSTDENGTYQLNWQQMNVPRGAFVSATALSSFAGNIIVKEM